jgi:hypothetical protein
MTSPIRSGRPTAHALPLDPSEVNTASTASTFCQEAGAQTGVPPQLAPQQLPLNLAVPPAPVKNRQASASPAANGPPHLPNELWGRILAHSRGCDLRAFRSSCQFGRMLVGSFEATQWAEAVASHCLRTNEPTLPGMPQDEADALLARLRTLRVSGSGYVSRRRICALLARCPNLLSIDLREVPLTWAQLRDFNLANLRRLQTLHLRVKDNSVYVRDTAFEVLFPRLSQLSLCLEGHKAAASLLVLPIKSLEAVQNLNLTVNQPLAAKHVRHLYLPRPERLLRFSLSAPKGVAIAGRRSLMDFLGTTIALQSVSLKGCRIDCENMQAFAQYDYVDLESLHISDGNLDVDGSKALSGLCAPKLRTLILEAKSLSGPEAVKNLKFSNFPALSCLTLVDIDLSEEACAALGEQRPAQLRQLDLRDCGLDDACIQALQLETWNELRYLDLSINELNTDFGDELLWDKLPKLEVLRMVDCGLEDTDMHAIPWAGMQSLRELTLRENALTAKSIFTLFAAGMPSLSSLDLSECTFDTFDVAEALPYESMRALWRERLPALEKLFLSDTGLTPPYLTWLHVGEIAKLQHLDLSDNSLGPNALHAFTGMTLPNLTSLSLDNSLAPQPWSYHGHKGIIDSVAMPELRKLLVSFAPEPSGLQAGEPALVPAISLGLPPDANDSTLARDFSTGGVCRVGTTAITACRNLTELHMCSLTDLDTSHFNARDFANLRKIYVEGDPNLTLQPLHAAVHTDAHQRRTADSLAAEGLIEERAQLGHLFRRRTAGPARA